MEKDLEYYLNLDWTLIHGTDLDFNDNTYHYIEIRELPEFAFCAPSQDAALANYKRQLKLLLMVKLESDDEIVEPADWEEEECIDPWD